MERRIAEVMWKMQRSLNAEQLEELEMVLQVAFADEPSDNSALMDLAWWLDLEDFLRSKTLEGRSHETIKRYRYELTRLLSYIGKPVAEVAPADISEYLYTYKQTRGVSNVTLKNARAVYSSFFAWAKERERTCRNPMCIVENINVTKRIKKPFSDKERARLVANCKTLRDKALIEFLYSTAVRVSELIRLNREDVLFSDQELIVLGKGSKERRVYLNEKSCLCLREYLQSRTDDESALFVSVHKPYRRLGKSGIEHIIRRVGQQASVSDAYPHRFRRTAATNALNRGMPIQEVSLMLGHVKLETTMLYCTADEAQLKKDHARYLNV